MTVVNFTSSGSWTAPAGVTSAVVECWGGGGGGSGGNNSSNPGSGGGGGAYSRSVLAVTPSTNYTVTVGAGGAGGTPGTPQAGIDGGDSWFNTSGTILAKGGQAGQTSFSGGTGGAAASGIGDTKFSGGNGNWNSATTHGGGAGSSAGIDANGESAPNGSAGAYLNVPAGGARGASGGEVGFSPGGGGSGGTVFGNGNVGAAGKVRITYEASSSPETYNEEGFWVCPTGVTTVQVEAWGGGGGGAHGLQGSGSPAGASGAGGAYSKKSITVTPGTVYKVLVGRGGYKGYQANQQSPNISRDGLDTYFDTTGTVLAKGGARGVENQTTTDAQGGQASAGVGDTKFSGGDGAHRTSTGTTQDGCGGGSSAGTAAAGNPGTDDSKTGATAPTGGGDGGTGGDATANVDAIAGANPGGGGGGGRSDGVTGGPWPGAEGGYGRIVLTYGATVHNVSANDTLSLSEVTAFAGDYNRSVTDALALTELAKAGLPRTASDVIALAEVTGVVKTITAQDLLVFSEQTNVSRQRNVSDALVLAEAPTVETVRSASDQLDLQEAPAVAGTFNRSAADAISLGEGAVRRSVSQSPCGETYVAGLGIRGTFSLYYPVTGSPTQQVDLRLPEFGNYINVTTQVKVKRTVSGQLRVSTRPTWPTVRTMEFSFTELSAAQRASVLAFIDAAAGREIRIRTQDDVQWRGIILSQTQPVSENGNGTCRYATSFKFIGFPYVPGFQLAAASDTILLTEIVRVVNFGSASDVLVLTELAEAVVVEPAAGFGETPFGEEDGFGE